MIEGSPITVCRKCGTAYSQVVLGTCSECDRADWDLCADLIKREDYIFMNAHDHIAEANKMIGKKVVTNG